MKLKKHPFVLFDWGNTVMIDNPNSTFKLLDKNL